MNDTLFLQFWHNRHISSSPHFSAESYSKKSADNDSVLCLNNGFSNTYDLCKQHGDFYWIEHGLGNDYLTDVDFEMYKATELPINHGKVYASTWYTSQLYHIWLLAKKYPDIEFTCGGTSTYVPLEEMPSNFKYTNKTVGQFFSDNKKYDWKLDYPVPKDRALHLSYSFNNHCYWKKCIFCNFSDLAHIVKDYPERYEFDGLYPDNPKYLLMYTPSYSPRDLQEFLRYPADKNTYYVFFMRASDETLDVFDEILSKTKIRPENIFPVAGIDATSDRILDIINKGTNINNYIKFVKICQKHNVKALLTTILGWPFITEKDIEDTQRFVDGLPNDYSKINIRLNKLRSLPARETYKYQRGSVLNIGPFSAGFEPYLSEKQLEMNCQIRDILISSGKSVVDSFTMFLEKNIIKAV